MQVRKSTKNKRQQHETHQEELQSAGALKNMPERLRGFTGNELAQVRIVAPGRRLRQGAVYLDLRSGSDQPLTASADMSASEDHLYVPERDTPQEIWNRLLTAKGKAEGTQADDLPEGTVDKTLEDSFPTSDPPAWTTGREPSDPGAPQAPREKRVEPEDQENK